ncbi:MAG: ABC transporter ATP-binding protein [Spirochaetia bacterium]
MTPLVAVTDLKTYYYQRSGLFGRTEVRAVDGVSLSISAGETLAVVGESGSGKTTLGRAILHLMKPVGGAVFFRGDDVATMAGRQTKAFRRRVQAIFQDPYSSISPYMNVHEIVEEPLIIHGINDRKGRNQMILQTLEQVKLSPAVEMAAKYPHALSGGQRQRVCIARAIVLRPELIVADEPVSMVDASSRAEILSLLRELQNQRGIAFLYITHDIANARHFSDRTIVMYAGTIVETGRTPEVIDRPLHPYTRALLAAVPDPNPDNRKRLRTVIPGEPPSGASVPDGCPFHTRCPESIEGVCDVERPSLKQTATSSFVGSTAAHEVACVLYE